MAPVTVRRVFEVPGNSPSNGGELCTAPFVCRSAVFSVGGYDWSILYYPISLHHPDDSVDLCLNLLTRGAKVSVAFSAGLLDPTASLPVWQLTDPALPPMELNSDDDHQNHTRLTHSVSTVELSRAPGPGYLPRGGLLLEITVTVFTPAPATDGDAAAADLLEVPASDLTHHLGKLYASRDGADVAYSVAGEVFRAHRIILAMRSPVFKAQLYGGMMESQADTIQVEDVRPAVFEALLRYIYTDTLPLLHAAATTAGGDDGGDAEKEDDAAAKETMCHLLVAADRYGVERLRVMCERKLCGMLAAGNVAEFLAFADEQRCDVLREACVEFMASSGEMKQVVESQGYKQLRAKRPLVLVEAFEKSRKFRKLSSLE